jgi:transposase, IS5 family
MVGQLGFSDHVVSGQRSRRKDQLGEIDGLIDWTQVAGLLRPLRNRGTGRPPYPPLVLFKALLLQRWYALSDEALEDALCDRLSFRRFVGLGLEEAIPDASTLCRFRSDMAAAVLGDALFAAVGRSLDARGLIVRAGTLIDASLIQAAVAEPRKQPGGGTSRVDPEASWAKKGSKATFGYKLHIAVDQGSGLVRAARITDARVADCTLGPDLVQGDEAAVYADMAYDNAAMRTHLAEAGIANAVMARPNRYHPLTPEAKQRNSQIGRIRGRVEGVFGTLKRSYRRHRLVYIGLAKNRLDLLLTLLAFNLRKARSLSRA